MNGTVFGEQVIYVAIKANATSSATTINCLLTRGKPNILLRIYLPLFSFRLELTARTPGVTINVKRHHDARI